MSLDKQRKYEEFVKIEKQKILFVEGKDDVSFFEIFLKVKKLKDIQVIECGGKEQFAKKFPSVIQLPDFHKVKSFAVIQDADQDVSATFQRICSVLKNNGFEDPPLKNSDFVLIESKQVGVFILPDGQNRGMLETLCLLTVESTSESKPIMNCVEGFMRCVDEVKGVDHIKNRDKARVRVFLSAMRDDTPSLGVATQKQYWNLESDHLKPLLYFLNKL